MMDVIINIASTILAIIIIITIIRVLAELALSLISWIIHDMLPTVLSWILHEMIPSVFSWLIHDMIPDFFNWLTKGLGLNKSREERREDRLYAQNQRIYISEEKREKKRREEEQKRRAMKCYFDDTLLSETEFDDIAKKAGNKIKRITRTNTREGLVYCAVTSQSGSSEWEFILDFNDYGKVTGNYWIRLKENPDSTIPEHLAMEISNKLRERWEKISLMRG